MKKKCLCISVFMLVSFIIWTLLISFVDVKTIGPEGSSVGFATLNGAFHTLTGTHMWLYTVTDWLGLVPIAVCLGFAIFGLAQWIKRKRFSKVDSSILALGGFYLTVMATYILFEYVVINRRPVLINGYLEASYPSSTTMLVMCVMPTALMQLSSRIKNKILRLILTYLIIGFTAFMVIGRLVSGVHWLTDIIGGAIVSSGLVLMYYGITHAKN